MKPRARWTVLALFALAACGGRARRASDSVAAGGGASSLDISGASGSAGDPGLDAESGASGADSGAYVSLIASDTRNCENQTYCFGLACYAPDSFAPNVCLARCKTDANCQPSEACVRAPQLEPTCYARCNSPADCYHGFDCFDFSGKGQLVCFPSGWAGRRDQLGY